MSPLEQSMRALLDKRKAHSAFRQLTLASPDAIDFSSNDFLSLSTSPELKKAFLEELERSSEFRIGSGGSRLLDGNSRYAEQLEQEIAAFHNAPAALLFNSGFDANSGFFSCIPQPGDVVVHDEFIHASVHEGMRLSRAGSCLAFSHNSIADLRAKLSSILQRDGAVAAGTRNVFIAVESLYSMDGDLAPIEEIVRLVDQMLPLNNGHIVVDEAHSNGIYGEQGRGIVCGLRLEDKIFARLYTFGKGLACNGGGQYLCSPTLLNNMANIKKLPFYATV
jgi:8-amino-7-oxononanoate synthase